MQSSTFRHRRGRANRWSTSPSGHSRKPSRWLLPCLWKRVGGLRRAGLGSAHSLRFAEVTAMLAPSSLRLWSCITPNASQPTCRRRSVACGLTARGPRAHGGLRSAPGEGSPGGHRSQAPIPPDHAGTCGPGSHRGAATLGLCQARRRSCEARASWVACCGDPDPEDARQSSGETVCTEHLKR